MNTEFPSVRESRDSRDPFSSMTPLDETPRPSWKAVYTIVDRGAGRRFFVRIGTAFTNRDQSLNVRLDAMPVSGQLHIRDPLPREGPLSRELDEQIPEFGHS